MFGNDRNQLRQMFFSSWNKYQNNLFMEPLEAAITDVILMHPEYHQLLGDEAVELDRDYTPEMGQTNPFLHMSMHISIQEQLSTQRPQHIGTIYQAMLKKNKDPHTVQHMMMECLGTNLWEAQSQNRLPDENDYIECLNQFI